MLLDEFPNAVSRSSSMAMVGISREPEQRRLLDRDAREQLVRVVAQRPRAARRSSARPRARRGGVAAIAGSSVGTFTRTFTDSDVASSRSTNPPTWNRLDMNGTDAMDPG